jgi:GDP-L-fucose synthase
MTSQTDGRPPRAADSAPREAREYVLHGKRVWVAGHRGMAGSAIVRRLAAEGCEVLTASRQEADLRRQDQVEAWMAKTRPQAVFMAAATVGGILANSTYPAKFLYDNLAIETNVIHAAWQAGVEKLLFLGSSCIYPRLAPQPMTEEQLLTGPLEPTNEWYAIAKIAGIKLCQAYRREHGCDFISAMPTNLYGPGDNYDAQSSHVAAAMQVKVHHAKLTSAPTIEIWGTGTPRREFLYVDDLADALIFMMKHYSGESHLNVGTGSDGTIRDLAELVAKVAGWKGEFVYDRSKPDGMPRKVMDVSKLTALGWTARTRLEDGFRSAYEWYVANAAARG